MDYCNCSDYEINKAVAYKLNPNLKNEKHRFTKNSGLFCSDEIADLYVPCDWNSEEWHREDSFDFCNDERQAWDVISKIINTLEKPVFDSDGNYICTEWLANTQAYNCSRLRSAMIVFLKTEDLQK